MIFRGIKANSPYIDIAIDGVALDYASIKELELSLEENSHDMLKVQFAGLGPKVMVSMLNRPVQLTWRFSAAKHVFTGYVFSVKPTTNTRQGLVNGSPFQTADVICMGSSSVLRGKKTRIWEKVTLANIVKELSNTYRFTFSIPNDSSTFPRVIQSEESDWEFLVRVASALGYYANMHGTHLVLWDRTRYLARRASYGEVLSFKDSTARTIDRPGVIIDMDASYELPSSSTASGIDSAGNRTGNIGPFSNNTGAGYEVNHLFNNELFLNTTSVGLANAVVRSDNIASKPFVARVLTQGLTGCLPGGIIRMDSYGSDTDGLWCIMSVKQRAIRDRFTSELILTRESTNDSPVNLPPEQFFAEVPDPVLR